MAAIHHHHLYPISHCPLQESSLTCLSKTHCTYTHNVRDAKKVIVPKTPVLLWENSALMKTTYLFVCWFLFGAIAPIGPGPPHLRGFLDHTQRRTTVGRTPLDEWSARRRDHYMTTHNTHNREPSMRPVGFEPIILAGELLQTHALDRADDVFGSYLSCYVPCSRVYTIVSKLAGKTSQQKLGHDDPSSWCSILPSIAWDYL